MLYKTKAVKMSTKRLKNLDKNLVPAFIKARKGHEGPLSENMLNQMMEEKICLLIDKTLNPQWH